jgi:hypothetical protein
MKDLTHGFAGGLYTVAALTLLAAILCLAITNPHPPASPKTLP